MFLKHFHIENQKYEKESTSKYKPKQAEVAILIHDKTKFKAKKEGKMKGCILVKATI